MIPGFDDGGDGGLFNGILARYLADAAVRRPELAPVAARLVLASAEAAWQGRADGRAGGPGVRPRLAPTRPRTRDRVSPKPTCRYSCRHGCSWKPPP